MAATVSFDAPEARIGHIGSLSLAFFRHAATLAILDELARSQEAIVQKYGMVASMTVIGQFGSATKIDEAVKKRSVEMSTKFDGVSKGTAIVLLSTGLSTVIVRTFLTGYFLLSKSTAPTKTFTRISDALQWLESMPGADPALRNVSAADIEKFTTAFVSPSEAASGT